MDRPLKVEIYSHVGILGRKHYWRVRHVLNGLIMAQGQGYRDTRDRDHAVEVLWPDLEVSPV